MRTHLWVYVLSSVGCLAMLACEDAPLRGSAGESCTSANDCMPGLHCYGQVCVPETDAGDSGPGASCSARRDCAQGLSCVANSCEPVTMGSDASNRYSGRGESCQAKNDCTPDLACVMGACRELTVPLSHTAKNCYRVECASKEDCCATFMPNPNCEGYKQNCESDPVFCNTYRSLCLCSAQCVDEQCVAAAPGCASNGECTSMQTPYCVEGKCRQCDQDSACSGSKCVDGVCMAACTIDENCPPLNRCESGVCVESGCKTDRECAFMNNNALATCVDGECRIPCTADPDCVSDKSSQGFGVCEDGQCVFVGCESNAECRALLHIDRSAGKVHAVCR